MHETFFFGYTFNIVFYNLIGWLPEFICWLHMDTAWPRKKDYRGTSILLVSMLGMAGGGAGGRVWEEGQYKDRMMEQVNEIQGKSWKLVEEAVGES